MCSLYPFRMIDQRPKSYSSTYARNFCVSSLPFFFVHVCVYVCGCVCLLLPRPTFLSSTNLQLLNSVRFLPVWFFLVSCFLVDILSYESTLCRLLGLPNNLPFYMPLMSILRLAVFLSLWSLKWCKRLGQFVIYGAVWSKRKTQKVTYIIATRCFS